MFTMPLTNDPRSQARAVQLLQSDLTALTTTLNRLEHTLAQAPDADRGRIEQLQADAARISGIVTMLRRALYGPINVDMLSQCQWTEGHISDLRERMWPLLDLERRSNAGARRTRRR